MQKLGVRLFLNSVLRRLSLILSFNSIWALLSGSITYQASAQKPHTHLSSKSSRGKTRAGSPLSITLIKLCVTAPSPNLI